LLQILWGLLQRRSDKTNGRQLLSWAGIWLKAAKYSRKEPCCKLLPRWLGLLRRKIEKSFDGNTSLFFATIFLIDLIRIKTS
jgi:hypothetical protein